MSDKTEKFVIADFSDSPFVNVGGIPHLTQRSIMPVVHRKDGKFRPVGTCFAISSQGLLMTAKHVIDDAYPQAVEAGHIEIDATEAGELYVVYTSPDKDPATSHYIGGLLPITQGWTIGYLDIGLMMANLPVDANTGERIRMPSFQLSPGIPLQGQSCMALGYHTMDWQSLEEMTARVTQSYSASRGIIEEVHFPMRDKAVLPFPCFRSSARYDGGMSGGPVISETGQVCGVVCSSYKLAEEEKGYLSYVSLIGPALLLPVNFLMDGQMRQHFLYEFIRDGAVVADHTYSALKISHTEEALTVDFGEGRQIVASLTG